MLNANKNSINRVSNDTKLEKGKTTYFDTKPINILLVEDVKSDEMLTRMTLKEACHPHNINVNVLRKGDEVMPFLLEKGSVRPDLIVLDLGLPGLSGLEVLKQLENAPVSVRAVPIIILSGNNNVGRLSSAGKLWISGSIKKPCSIEDVKGALEDTPLLSLSPAQKTSPLTLSQRPLKLAQQEKTNWAAMIANDQGVKIHNNATAERSLIARPASLILSAISMLTFAFFVYASFASDSLDFSNATNQKMMTHNPEALAVQLNTIEPGELY